MTVGLGTPWPPDLPAAGPPRPYPQLLRGPAFRWWRPLLAVFVGVAVVLLVVFGVALVGAVVSGGGPDRASDWSSPVSLLVTNLMLAALVPAVLVSVRVAYGRSARWVSSVAPGLRRRWLLRCYPLALVSLAIPGVGLAFLDGYQLTPEHDWPALVVVVLLTTPLQAAGEEFAFRGWIPQLIGSAVPGARAGALAGGAVSTTLFAVAHGQQDVWLFSDRFCFGAIACWLAWRTGGLEAGIALHGANNLVALLLAVGAGDLDTSLNATEGTATYLVFDVVTLLAATVLVLWSARRARIARVSGPPPWPAASDA